MLSFDDFMNLTTYTFASQQCSVFGPKFSQQITYIELQLNVCDIFYEHAEEL